MDMFDILVLTSVYRHTEGVEMQYLGKAMQLLAHAHRLMLGLNF